jgi:Putative MetA-pathway of phenol degradation
MGSFQSENGINLSSQNGGRTVDGTNSRWRLGIAPCPEVLVDLPTYFTNVKLPGSSGFSDVAPAVKWQISPVPGKVDLSMTVGISLPTGAVDIAGRGAQP